MVDYLQAYIVEGKFDIPRMLNDDHCIAIKLLFSNGKYVSAAKLLVSFIDTVSFVEHGDIQGSFTKWLDAYADLAALGISSEEVWEFRNSILHMSNLDSRKVIKGAVPRLIPFVDAKGRYVPANTPDEKHLDLVKLYHATSRALENWLASYANDPAKIQTFVQRYDSVLSDHRVLRIQH